MSKVTSLSEAVELVPDGSRLALTGFAITRNAIAVCHELIRAGRRDLELSQVIGGMETDLLAGAGCLSRLVYSGGSLDRFGPLHSVNRAIDQGMAVAEYSSLALTLRFHAGGLGLPFIPTRSMLGSDLLRPLLAAGEARLDEDPFTGSPALLLAPLRPEVGIVHVDVADELGNAVLTGPSWSVRETVYAARTAIVVAEEIVPGGSLSPDAVAIPAALVSAVVAVPRGAHPTSLHGRYDYDRAHLLEYAKATREGPTGFKAYLERFVLGADGHGDYLTAAKAMA